MQYSKVYAGKYLLVIFAFCLASCSAAGEAAPVNQKPLDSAVEEPIIDGNINQVEWQNAAQYRFAEGSDLFLMISGEHLYLAVRASGEEMIAGNVYLLAGDEISVMHTSAALGTALYLKEGKKYQKIQDFDWCCRPRANNESSRLEREDFYARDGWLGANSFLGSENELEYKINLDGGMEAIAVNFLRVDEQDVRHSWPIGLEDGVSLPVKGELPEWQSFEPQGWYWLGNLQ